MKRSLIMFIVLLSVAAVLFWGDFLEAGYTRAAWEEQIHGMGYLILHLSSINAINGMNLTPDQARRLGQMAHEVEAISEKIPDFETIYRPDLAEVLETYLEVRKYIICGQDVPEELRQRVVRARSIESAVIRLSLSNNNFARSSCLRCHREPSVLDLRQNERMMAGLTMTSRPNFIGLERETFLAHMAGVFGKRGLLKLMTLSVEVDRLLTDSQKEILKTFTCCIIPPKELSDPVRAGQATSGEKEIEILRKVRKVPETFWPYAKSQGLKKLEQLLVFKFPGITADKIKTICDRVGKIYEKARKLSDVDFEMEKGDLAEEITRIGTPKKELDNRQQGFMNALFLFIPGSSEIYDNISKRLETGLLSS
ncbi:MAG: hypothetical protein PVH61_21160 [Candidatus Aminicenantes bacterium]|jgi:hypothetical protein